MKEGALGGLLSFRVLRWLLIPVVALHNFEEWLTFSEFGEVGAILAAKMDIPIVAPSWPALQLALAFVTFAPAAIVAWASTGRQTPTKHFLVLWIAGIFLANVFLPHVPAAFLAGGYSPGILSAAAINFPFCLLLYRSALRDGVASMRLLVLAGTLGLFALPLAVIGGLSASEMLVGAM